MNCQGLGAINSKKRRDVMNYLRDKSYSIICLQDTHFTPAMNNFVRSEWGYEAYFSSYSSQSRGVAILFKNNFEFTIHSKYKDESGNILILDFTVENQRITLVNLYAPNRDDPDFFSHVKEEALKLGNQNIIMVGDWNLILNPELDCKNYKHVNNPTARRLVLELMSELDLCDVWREENPDTLKFTWRRKHKDNTVQMGRLDFFLVSGTLLSRCLEEKISPGYRTDHSLVSLTLRTHKTNKQRTFWKFNNSLLRSKEYADEIKNVIKSVKSQYAATPFNPEVVGDLDNREYQSTLDDQLFLEILLLEIRGKTIAFSSAKKREKQATIKAITKEIERLESSEVIDENLYDQILIKKEQLKSLREEELWGALIRSKVRWIEEGEKPTKYFCNLESRHFISKRMSSLIGNCGQEITEANEILSEVKDFYERLYSSREESIEEVDLEERLHADTPKLSTDKAQQLDGPILYEEATRTLKGMKNNKSPGTDGFTVEFLKFFWKDLAAFIIKSINCGFEKGRMSVTQREGVITCIPKGNKSKKFLKNWRPISLLNVIYKIASGAIANRVKSVLPEIISHDQCGFMANRSIGDNIRLVYDTLKYAESTQSSGILLLIDFEKAFDSISHSFLMRTLEYFNFGVSIRKWIEILNRDVNARVQVNGTISPSFFIQRGCRQGDPLSPYLFLICSEILAHMLRQNDRIRGYFVKEVEVKICQYADDTSIFLDGSEESFEYCIGTILEYAKYSGLAMNFEKTKAIWLGHLNTIGQCFSKYDFEWNPNVFTILGIDFRRNLHNIADENISKKIPEMEKQLNVWAKRDLTPLGKAVILKSLNIAKIVHILMSLPNPNQKLLKEIQSLYFKFLWGGKPDKIKRIVATQRLENGGLGMVNINKFNEALKVSWLRRLLNNEVNMPWKRVLQCMSPNIFDILNAGPIYAEKMSLKLQNPFWSDVLNSYVNFAHSVPIKTSLEFSSQSFLYNKDFRIDKRVITEQTLIDKGVVYIHQLQNQGQYLTYEEFKNKYNIKLNFLLYTAIINVIKATERQLAPTNMSGNTLPYQKPIHMILNSKKGSQIFYRSMISVDFIPPGVKKWYNTLSTPVVGEWKSYFRNLINATGDTKLRWFQFRLLHNILTTNRSASKFIQDQNDKCEFCKVHSETIHHLFLKCGITRRFWTDLSNMLNANNTHGLKTTLDDTLILFGETQEQYKNTTLNFLLILAKHFIYKSKVQKTKPNLQHFKHILTHRYEVENQIQQTYKSNPIDPWAIFRHCVSNDINTDSQNT